MASAKRAYPGSKRNGSWGGRTTRILVEGEAWDVPRGFGAMYKRCVAGWGNGRNASALSDLLSAVGFQATPTAVLGWPLRKRVDAEVWAISTHLSASDNPVMVPPRPDWMGEPWKGPEQGVGIWASNPTVLT